MIMMMIMIMISITVTVTITISIRLPQRRGRHPGRRAVPPSRAGAGCAERDAAGPGLGGLRGNHLSNTTYLTQVFSNSGE